MVLNYLDFDVSEEHAGAASWDAMASTVPLRLPDALGEAQTVLQWAHLAFGLPDAAADELGQWDFDLQLVQESAGRNSDDLGARFDAATGQIATRIARPDGGYCVLTLTLSGSAAFGRAFTEQFGLLQ